MTGTKGAFKTQGQTELYCSVRAIRLRLFFLLFFSGESSYLLAEFLGCSALKVQLSLKA